MPEGPKPPGAAPGPYAGWSGPEAGAWQQGPGAAPHPGQQHASPAPGGQPSGYPGAPAPGPYGPPHAAPYGGAHQPGGGHPYGAPSPGGGPYQQAPAWPDARSYASPPPPAAPAGAPASGPNGGIPAPPGMTAPTPPQNTPYASPPQRPGWAPQGPGWASQPPRGPAAYPPAWRAPYRRSSAGAIVGAVMGVLALVFVLVVIVGALAGLRHREEPVSPVAIPTFSPLPSWEPTGDTRPARTPASRPTPKPTARSTPVLDRSTKNNTLYRAGSLARTNCRAGNASIYNHAQLKALMLKTGTCMGKAWAPALKRVGIRWSPPRYMIAARKGRGACGDYPAPGSNVPYYCPGNATIYASTSAMAREYGPLGSWHGIIISVMAHEYGHHVQSLSGISDSWWRQTLDSTSRSGRLALSRRHELQATCFGGMFMRSVAASYPIDATRRNTLLWAYGYLGDQPGGPRDHGSTRSNAAWFRQGYTRPKAYQCNTWVVGSSYVS